MTADAYRLGIGTRVWFEDEQHDVVGFTETATRLRSESGGMQLVATGALLADPSFRRCVAKDGGARSVPPVDVAAMLAVLPTGERDRVTALQDHLLELTTGYRSGEPAQAEPGEPRPGFEPGRSMEDRVATKAAELGVSGRCVWKYLRRWREQGLWGLVDGRSKRLSHPLAGLDHRIVDAVLAQDAAEYGLSSGSPARFRRRVQRRLDTMYGEGVVRLPPPSTFHRKVGLLLHGRNTFGPATTREAMANQPPGVYATIEAARPGEVVMLDTSRLDVIAYDPLRDVTFPVEITIAIDIATRSLLAWRLNPLGTKAVDAAMLIADAMTPEPMRPGWPESLRFVMLRLPVQRVLSADERFAAAAARPVIYPELIVIDHGKAFASDAVKDACRRHGITIQDCRAYRPTGKPQVEAAFAIIGSQFAQHVAGYKGPNVAYRGRDVDGEARWTLGELEELFAEYVVAVYQRRRHEGLFISGFPEINLSPNDAYRMAVAYAGFVACPRDPNLFLELMQVEWRAINHDGVDIDSLTYTGEAVARYRRTKSPYQHKNGLWPIHYDPRDPSQVYLQDSHERDVWHTLRWTHAPTGLEPFTDVTLREVKRELAARGRNPADQHLIAQVLIDLQNRSDAPEASTAKSRRARVRDAERARAAARDRARLAVSTQTQAESSRPLWAVPDLPAEVDVDVDQIQTYEVWTGRPTDIEGA